MTTHTRTRKKKAAAAPKSGDQGVRLSISSMAVGPKTRADISRQIKHTDDVWSIDSNLVNYIIATPYPMHLLANALEISNVMRQCIQSYVVNIASYGYRVVPRYDDKPMDEAERRKLQSFVEFANPDESLSSVVKKQVHDHEHYGFGFYEVIRNKKGGVGIIRQAKAAITRVMRTNSEDEYHTVESEVARGGSSRATIKERKRFKRYVQQHGTGVIGTGNGAAHENAGWRIYFKEFGDPRKMSYKTGQYDSEEHPVPKDEEATEILQVRQYSEDSYGVPRWISQLPSIVGSREAEEVNMRYFEDNTVPPALLTVSGGRLTRDSFRQLKTLLEQDGVGKARQNKILLIEAVPETAGLEEKGQVKVQLDKLTDARQSDALFKSYDEGNMAKVRSSFRLPPALIGLSQDVTFATANTSVYIAESQVFLPERKNHDEALNKNLVHGKRGMNLQTVKLESRGPLVTNPDQLVKALIALNTMGGLTPRKSIEAMNEVLDWSLENYPAKGAEGYEEWMDTPISISMKTPRGGENGQETDGESAGKDNDVNSSEKGETKPPEHGQE